MGISPSMQSGTAAVVVGAAQGIGAGIAVGLARAGADVVLVGRSLESLQGTAAAVAEEGTLVGSEVVDVASPTSIEELAAAVQRRLGRAPTVLVNAANVRLIASALDTNAEDWDHTHAVHLRGPFLTARAFAPGMIEQGYGKVVNFSSHWAVRVGQNRVAYSAAKAGVGQMTAALGVEWAPHGIRVNAIAPAATATKTLMRRLANDPARAQYLRDLIPLGRMSTVDDIVPVAVFLASPGSDFITGQTLFVDGGASVAG